MAVEYKKIKVVTEHVTHDMLSKFEIARIIACRIDDVAKGSKFNLDRLETLILVDNVESINDRVVVLDGKKYIQITDTATLAMKELNLNKCPYLIERKLYEDAETIYVEHRDPNTMIKPLL
jgi:DNA-directed RNA polymerase subunit K/omega